MTTVIQLVKRSMSQAASKWVLSATALAGLGLPSIASAHDYRDSKPRVNVDIRIGDRDRCEPVYEDRRVQVWVPVQYRTVCEQRFIEPVYTTQCEKVWVEPVYQTRCEKVWCPDQWQVREVRRFDNRCGRWVIVQERILVSPGHFDSHETRVCVTPGGWQNVERRVCVSEGRYEKCERQELVCEGHYETRIERVKVAERRRGSDGIEVILPILAQLERTLDR